MTRLILEEGDRRRAFRVHKGTLTIGSGAECTLILSSPDVAEIHAELEVGEEGVFLRPRPGVVPPTLDGRPVRETARVPARGEVRIGAAVLRIESDAAEAASSSAAPARAANVKAPAAPRAPLVARDRSVVQPSRPIRKIERGLPTWAVLAILAGIGLAGVFVGTIYWSEATTAPLDPHIQYQKALQAFEGAAHARALHELDAVDLDYAPALRPQVEDLRRKIREREDAAKLAAWNMEGTKVLDTQLRRYFDQRLQGDRVPRSRARVFVKRCIDFRKRWPQHPEIGWVERYQQRFEPMARLDEPPELEDMAFEVETLTWAKPRDYRQAFALIAEFQRTAVGRDREEAAALERKLDGERQEHFVDRMQQAKWHWERGEATQSVSELVNVVIYMGDQGMADEAARELVALPRSGEHIESYQRSLPEKFALLIENETVRAAARKHGLVN